MCAGRGRDPASLVDQVVMPCASGDERVEVGLALIGGPFGDVVDLAAVERHVAVADAAGAVHRSERPALVVAGQPPAAAQVERDTRTVEYDRDDVGVAGKPAQCLDGEDGSVVEFADRRFVESGGDRLEVDECQQLDPPGSTLPTGRGGEVDEGVRSELLAASVRSWRHRPRASESRRRWRGRGVRHARGRVRPGASTSPCRR